MAAHQHETDELSLPCKVTPQKVLSGLRKRACYRILPHTVILGKFANLPAPPFPHL